MKIMLDTHILLWWLADDKRLSESATHLILNPGNQIYISIVSFWEMAFKIAKERAWNNLNNYGAGFLFLTKRSQEAHSWSTQRLRSFRQEKKDKPECSIYFMHVPKVTRNK